ncbi:hypothetical protein NliqN6_6215 [Naganishia liquefaciens]|uniref:S-formylglutathione hydrolase n=1 Tax=Naganishia liquefaciens TaxID=104408 RepID=A0A8H3YHX9_9TREE|nr:hypothetical protein NliqN6_6215 [Naganishia liquefaciens]
MSLKQESYNKAFEGSFTKYSFESSALGGLTAKINVFLPPGALSSSKVPVLYYLAGLTCTEDTGAQKGAFLAEAAKQGIAVVFPDTSPRGAGVEGEDKDWDFGTGAGFYLTATSEAYKKNYNMYEHIVKEIPEALEKADLGIDKSKVSIFGHSMGGHGALSLYLKNPGHYKSASGFAPIANPTECQWGQKAFSGYLASPEEGKAYDSTLLLSSYPKDQKLALKIDYGSDDQFYKDGQLRPEAFQEAVSKAGRAGEVDLQRREGYDHSYYFVSTFASEHVAWHAKYLKA